MRFPSSSSIASWKKLIVPCSSRGFFFSVLHAVVMMVVLMVKRLLYFAFGFVGGGVKIVKNTKIAKS